MWSIKNTWTINRSITCFVWFMWTTKTHERPIFGLCEPKKTHGGRFCGSCVFVVHINHKLVHHVYLWFTWTTNGSTMWLCGSHEPQKTHDGPICGLCVFSGSHDPPYFGSCVFFGSHEPQMGPPCVFCGSHKPRLPPSHEPQIHINHIFLHHANHYLHVNHILRSHAFFLPPCGIVSTCFNNFPSKTHEPHLPHKPHFRGSCEVHAFIWWRQTWFMWTQKNTWTTKRFTMCFLWFTWTTKTHGGPFCGLCEPKKHMVYLFVVHVNQKNTWWTLLWFMWSRKNT